MVQEVWVVSDIDEPWSDVLFFHNDKNLALNPEICFLF